MDAVETGTDQVTAVLDERVLVVTLNRPEARNALSRALLEGLAQALDTAETSSQTGAVLLTGAGPAFCAGGDVKLMAVGRSIFGEPDDPAGTTAVQADLQRRTAVRLRELGKPTVAAIRGPAVGAGLSLALACDVRVAAESATLMTGFARVGLAGDFGCSWLLHDLAGPAVARELLYGSAPVSAPEALAKGLVNAVVPDDQLDAEARRRAHAYAAVPAPAAAVIAETARLTRTLSLAEASDRDAEHHVRLTGTPEHREAVERLVRSMERKEGRADRDGTT